ncbi:MAG: MATE family efflux transporter [Eubacterium sp.]|nr:MATE family efflux transporter [Eubacterium sp.]
MQGHNNKTIDMTQGPLLKPLILFILPIVGGSVFQQLYNTVDFLFVGNFLDKTAAAAVGSSSNLIAITVGLFTGISVGCSVVAANAIGANDEYMARKVLHTSVTFGIIGGIVILVLGFFGVPSILRLLNTPESVLPQAIQYIRIYLFSIPMLVFYNMVSGCLRAEGDSRSPFIVLAVCGLLNVVFDALFIVVMGLGVAGAAIATTVTQSLSALFVGVLASRKDRMVRLNIKELGIDSGTLWRILGIGLPTGIQTIVITLSNVIVQYFINGYGDTAVAAFATYFKVENLNWLSIVAFGQAAVTFVGQNMGAGHYRRILKGTITIVALGIASVVCISGLVLLFPNTVFRWFMKDPDVIEIAVKLAMIAFPFYFIYPVLEVLSGAVRAIGRSVLSMVIVIFNMCVLRIALLAMFSGTFHTVESVVVVYPITWATCAVTFIFIFARLMVALKDHAMHNGHPEYWS